MKRICVLPLAVFLVLMIHGCGSGGPNSSGSTNVTIAVGSAANASPSRAPEAAAPAFASIRFTITAADMAVPIVRTVAYTGSGTVQESFLIPSGADRHFLVELLDADGNVLYSGEATASLLGTPVTVPITLSPVGVGTTVIDWPMFRGDAGNSGASRGTITLPLTEQWHSTAPPVEENGVVIVNGVAYMYAQDGNLYAFDVTTGSAVAGFPVMVGAQTYGTPSVDFTNGKIYLLAGSAIYAFNMDGSLSWSRSVGGAGANYNQSPVIDNGYVYFKSGFNLFKYDSAGILQWSTDSAGNNTQPSIMGGYVYVNTEGGNILKYDKSTGTPVVGGGFPIATGYSQSSLAAVNGRIFHKSDLLYAYDAATGGLLWSQAIGGDSTYYDSPAVSGGAVYVYGWDGRVYAFDETTGTPMSGFPSVVLNTGSRNWSSPTTAGDKIFVAAGTTQKLMVLGAAGSAQAGQVIEEHQLFSADGQGFDLCSPIVSDGWVFIMLDGGGLYTFIDSRTR